MIVLRWRDRGILPADASAHVFCIGDQFKYETASDKLQAFFLPPQLADRASLQDSMKKRAKKMNGSIGD
ncbi:hypothetical protein VU06_04720 [Desulfobulbus sp. F3]|nr:hypothetical protein [Desulfobulbus sp. F3]